MGESILSKFREARAALAKRREELEMLIQTSQEEHRQIVAELGAPNVASSDLLVPAGDVLRAFLRSHAGATAEQILSEVGVAAKHMLAPMVRKGLLRAEGPRGAYRYYLPEST